MCQLSDTAHPAPHICRNSGSYPEVSPGSDPKEMSLPLSEFLDTHLKPLPLTVTSRLPLHDATSDRFPAWTEDLSKTITCLIFAHPFLWGLEALFSLFAGILNNPASLMEPTLWVADPICLSKCHIEFLGK